MFLWSSREPLKVNEQKQRFRSKGLAEPGSGIVWGLEARARPLSSRRTRGRERKEDPEGPCIWGDYAHSAPFCALHR